LSLKKRANSFVYAFKGIKTLFATQANARIHGIAIILVTLCGFYFNINKNEWCLIIFACTIVLMAEAFNTAIEFIVDLVSPDYHPLAGKAKDVAAAAVLITAIGAAGIGFLIFLPKIF
jgi:diacylglycerol kinase (ATP)